MTTKMKAKIETGIVKIGEMTALSKMAWNLAQSTNRLQRLQLQGRTSVICVEFLPETKHTNAAAILHVEFLDRAGCGVNLYDLDDLGPMLCTLMNT